MEFLVDIISSAGSDLRSRAMLLPDWLRYACCRRATWWKQNQSRTPNRRYASRCSQPILGVVGAIVG